MNHSLRSLKGVAALLLFFWAPSHACAVPLPDGPLKWEDVFDVKHVPTRGSVIRATVAPDGRHAVLSASPGVPRHGLKFIDLEAAKETHAIDSNGPAQIALFTPDGKQLIAGSINKTIHIVAVDTRKEIRCLAGHEFGVISLALSGDGRYLLSGDYSVQNQVAEQNRQPAGVRLWELATGKEIRRFDHARPVLAVAFWGDSEVASVTGSGVSFWDKNTGRQTRLVSFISRPGRIDRVAFGGDGTMLATGADNGALRTWDLKAGKETCHLATPSGIHGLAVSSDGQHALTAHGRLEVRDGEKVGVYEVHLWDLKGQKLLMSFNRHQHFAQGLAFTPDGGRLVTGDVNGDVYIHTFRRFAPARRE